MTAFNGTALSYDLSGNLTGDGTNSYTWDARNHLVGITGGATASFVYDALGRRAGKTIGANTTQFVYDGLNPVQELDGANPANVTANLLSVRSLTSNQGCKESSEFDRRTHPRSAKLRLPRRPRAVDPNSRSPSGAEGDRLTTPRREIRVNRAGLPKSSYLWSPSSCKKPRTRANFAPFSGESATSKTRWRRGVDLNPRDPSESTRSRSGRTKSRALEGRRGHSGARP